MPILLIIGTLLLALRGAQADQIPVRKLSAEREVLRAVVAITTMPPSELDKIPAVKEIEHDSEVARSELVLVVVMAPGCQANPQGECNASADVVAYKPDGSVHSEMKGITLTTHRGTAVLRLASDDVTGVYRVEATVRDLQAQRFAKTERLFGVK
jgi:hypothetical protein